MGHALEWREVRQPAWQAEDRAEESLDDAGHKDRPRHADPARYQPVECDGEPDHDPHGRRVDEGGHEQTWDVLHAAACDAVCEASGQTGDGEQDERARESDCEVTRRELPARDGRRQDQVGAHGRFLAPHSHGGLDGETRGDERHQSEGGSEIRIRQTSASASGKHFGEGLVLADEGVHGGSDPAVGDADDHDAGAPSEQRSPL